MSNIFEIKQLKKYYETSNGLFKKPTVIKAIDDVSFSVESGKILSVVGESGCGKSTLAKVLMGIESITSGEILFEGKLLNTFGSKTGNYTEDPCKSSSKIHTQA